MSGFDHVVVGAGTGGSVLAAELTRDPGTTVLLLEAGPKDTSPVFHVPKGFAFTIENAKRSWVYETEPFGPLGQREAWSRGRVLGGSSAINGMVWNRGWREDWDELEALGNPGWGWDDVLPVLRGLEDHQLGASETRGAGGPVHISVQTRGADPMDEAMLDAAQAAGLPRVDDLNASGGERVGYAPANIKRGLRQSTAVAFLKPARGRPNLTVRTGVRVVRLVFEGDRVVGVELRTGKGTTEVVRARREVVLAAGNFETSKLLELSGIGQASVLRAAGIDVRLERDQVGENVREQRYVTLQLRLKARGLGYNRTLHGVVGQGLAGLRYLATRRGPIATPAYDTVGFLKSRPELPHVDAQILMTPFSQGVLPIDIGVEERPGATLIGYLLRPQTLGSQHVTSADPAVDPRVVPNYDFVEADRVALVDVFRRMRTIAAQSPLADHVHGESEPGHAVQDDASIVDHALLRGGTTFHAAGSCAMGPSEDAVVDARLRVRGVEGLRIVDASVLPMLVSGNINAPLMAVAVKAARMVQEDAEAGHSSPPLPVAAPAPALADPVGA